LRLLRDANLFPRGIAARLREAGHDVLALAASEQRVCVTRNSRDFGPLGREWAEAQGPHAGLILIRTLDHSQFAAIVAGVERYLERWPSHEQWHGLTVAF
jgi:hypothetical protein